MSEPQFIQDGVNKIYPSHFISSEEKQFKQSDLEIPLKIVCDYFNNSVKDKKTEDLFIETFRGLLGLKAAEKQLSSQKVNSTINWSHWEKTNDWDNFYITIEPKKGSNMKRIYCQIKSTKIYGQFLLLNSGHYDKSFKYKGDIISDFNYEKFILERIDLEENDTKEVLKQIFDKLCSGKSDVYDKYCYELNISYDFNAYWIDRDHIKEIAESAPKGTIIKAKEDSNSNIRLDNKCYYVAVENMDPLKDDNKIKKYSMK